MAKFKVGNVVIYDDGNKDCNLYNKVGNVKGRVIHNIYNIYFKDIGHWLCHANDIYLFEEKPTEKKEEKQLYYPWVNIDRVKKFDIIHFVENSKQITTVEASSIKNAIEVCGIGEDAISCVMEVRI
jgi:hypothetical protein